MSGRVWSSVVLLCGGQIFLCNHLEKCVMPSVVKSVQILKVVKSIPALKLKVLKGYSKMKMLSLIPYPHVVQIP